MSTTDLAVAKLAYSVYAHTKFPLPCEWRSSCYTTTLSVRGALSARNHERDRTVEKETVGGPSDDSNAMVEN